MSLLREIENDLATAGGDITIVLRKARILAARLKNKGFEEWIHRELNGYPDKAALPSYRILEVNSKAHLLFGWQQVPAAPVMARLIPERLRHWATTAYLLEGISQYASLVSDCDPGNATLQSLWPQELAVKYAGSGYNDPQVLSAWQEITRASLVGVIETVRNKLLDFVLEIEAENPDAGEAPPDTQPVPPERVQQLVNNYFAPVGNIAQHGRDFNQTANIGLQLQDLATLVTEFTNHLDDLNLNVRQKQKAQAQIATLKAQLTDEPDPLIVQQAGRTLRNITESAIASLLATAAQPAVWHTVQGLLARFPH
ncbi:MAG: hypothetical protein ABSE93_18215 [Terriglobia bacterium]|jgi:hypothetical protein